MTLCLTNLNKSLMSDYEPDWQREVIKRAEEDPKTISRAEEINAVFKARALEALNNEGWIPGLAIKELLRSTPRYTYVKNIFDHDGYRYEAEIDLLFQTISFNRHKMKGYVRIIETGEIVEVYIWYANGVGYVGKNGIRFIPEGQYEIIDNKE